MGYYYCTCGEVLETKEELRDCYFIQGDNKVPSKIRYTYLHCEKCNKSYEYEYYMELNLSKITAKPEKEDVTE